MSKKCIDLTGQKFGRLTVIERAENKGSKICWLCKCECGNEKVIRSSDLKSGKINSCGCLKSEKMSEHLNDLTGMKFGRITVIERVKNKGRVVCWLCECECGKTKVVRGNDLKNGKTTSCGCLQKEKVSKQMTIQMKEKWQDEEFREAQSQKMKEQWQDDEMKWKMSYKGGITPISKHLRRLNEQWFEDCKQQVDYTCQLTGKHGGNLHTHHLKAFSTIVIEAHDLHNIQIKDQVKDYTQEELKLLEEYVGSWHKDNSNAVVLCEDVHKLFHSLYGKGENTPEQFEEFRERYMTGEFKEI